MNFNDLGNVWRRQAPVAPLPSIDIESLKATFDTKRRRLARGLFWRDMIEIIAGLFVAVAFGYTAWQMGPGGWPVAISVLLVLGVVIFFARERLRAHRLRSGVDASLLQKLDADIAELKHQRGLILNVDRLYIAPLMLAAAIFGATVLAKAPTPLVVKLSAGGIQLCILVLVWWGVRWINHLAVRKNVDPQLRELGQLRQALASEPGKTS